MVSEVVMVKYIKCTTGAFHKIFTTGKVYKVLSFTNFDRICVYQIKNDEGNTSDIYSDECEVIPILTAKLLEAKERLKNG